MIKKGVKLIYSVRIALSLVLVIYLMQHVFKLIFKYRSNGNIDKLSLYSQTLFFVEKLLKLVRDTNGYNIMHLEGPIPRLFISLHS